MIRHRPSACGPVLSLAAILIAVGMITPAAAQDGIGHGGFELETIASAATADNAITVTGHENSRLALDCASWRYDSDVDVDLSAAVFNMQMVGKMLLVEQRDGSEGNIQAGMRIVTTVAELSDISFSYAARFKRSDPLAAGYGKINWVTDAGQEQRDFAIPKNALTPIQSWWAMVDKIKRGQRRFSQDLTLFGMLGAYQLGSGTTQTATFEVVPSPFADYELPEDPDGAFGGESWAVRVTIPTDDPRYGGAKTAVFQLFESGVIGYAIAEEAGNSILLSPVSVRLLKAPKC